MLQRARSWFFAPEQEMLRWELAWFARWIRRPFVLCWLFIWVAVSLWSNWFMFYTRKFLLEYASMRPAVDGSAMILLNLSMIFIFLLPFIGWYHLFSRRIAIRTEKEHIFSLLLIPSESSRLWPAMVASPALWFGLFGVLATVPKILLLPFYYKYYTESVWIYVLEIPIRFVAGLAITSAAAEKTVGATKGKALFWPILIIVAYIFLIIAVTIIGSGLIGRVAWDVTSRLLTFAVLLLIARHYINRLRDSRSWQALVQKRTLLNA